MTYVSKVKGDETYVVVDKKIIVFKRTVVVRTYSVHNCKILGVIVMGNLLVSYDDSNTIVVRVIRVFMCVRLNFSFHVDG